jgi:hypothetical protein
MDHRGTVERSGGCCGGMDGWAVRSVKGETGVATGPGVVPEAHAMIFLALKALRHPIGDGNQEPGSYELAASLGASLFGPCSYHLFIFQSIMPMLLLLRRNLFFFCHPRVVDNAKTHIAVGIGSLEPCKIGNRLLSFFRSLPL